MNQFPINEVRNAFPALKLKHNELKRIYLDNPAGTQVPYQVSNAVSESMTRASSNLGGYFDNSLAADKIWNDAHQAIAVMLGALKEEVIIGPAMTALTFHMSRSIGHDFKQGDEIIVTRMDHEGDISPWLHLAEDKNLVIKWLSFNKETWKIEEHDLKALLTEKTKLVALNYASNLTGSINNIKDLTTLAKTVDALVYVDAVQLAPHHLIDVNALGCDFLACSSYKFYGPHLGILWGRKDLLEVLPAYKCRCASDKISEKFELGTPQTELLAGLTATVDYFSWLGQLTGTHGNKRENIEAAYESAMKYENNLTLKLIDGISSINGTKIYGITDKKYICERVPTVSFTHNKNEPADIASKLAGFGVCCWSGHNYAYEVVRHLGINEHQGVVRLGIAHYNTDEEIDYTLKTICNVLD